MTKYFDKDGNVFASSYEELCVLHNADSNPVEFKSGDSYKTFSKKVDKNFSDFCKKK